MDLPADAHQVGQGSLPRQLYNQQLVCDGLVGRITPQILKNYGPTGPSVLYYISGPNVMVNAVKHNLHLLGIPDRQIKTDFFAGL